jgi:hypothetical protein
MIKKLLALALVLLVILSLFPLKETFAQPDPYKDLEKWLIDNLNILGLTMYRGPQFSALGNYIDPTINFMVQDYETRKSQSMSMKFSEYVNYVQNNKLVLQMNVTSSGYERCGPPGCFGYPPFSYIYKRALNDTSVLAWGTYLTSNLPSYSMTSNEPVEYTINIFEWKVKNIFHENPQYLYSYLVLGNGSSVKLPKGENILLALSPYKLDTSVYELIKSTFKGSIMPYPNYPSKILQQFSEDDTSAGLLYVTWEVEGNSGYLKPATVLKYTHPIVSKITLVHYASGPFMRLQNENMQQLYNEAVKYDMERINKVNLNVEYEIVNTTIFAPFGSPTKSFTTFVDLSNKDATSLFKSTSVYYIIDPKVYSGKDKIKLKIFDPKGKINLTYEINIEIDKERFVIKDINLVNTYTFDRSKTFFVGGSPFEDPNLQAINTIIIHSEKSYNEDGSLSLKLNYKQNSRFFAISQGTSKFDVGPWIDYRADDGVGNYVASKSISGYETGTINIYLGGSLPNPSPATTSTFDFSLSSSGHSNYHEYVYHNYNFHLQYLKERVLAVWYDPWRTSAWGCSWKGEVVEYRDIIKFGTAYHYGSGYSNFKYNIESGILIIKDNKLIFKVVRYGSYYSSSFSSYSSGAVKKDVREWFSPLLPPCGVGVDYNYNGYFYAETIPYYISSSFSSESSQNYGWTIFDHVSEYNLTQAQPIEITESPALLISLDKNQAMVDEEITGYIISYGKNSIGSTVSLNAYVEFNNTKVPIIVNPNKLTISEGKDPSFTLKMPSYATLRSKFGENMPTKLTVTINAKDSRGVNATQYIILNAKGYFIVLNLKDVDLNIPDDPWQSNVLENALLINTTNLKIGGFSLYISILEKGSMKEVYKAEIKDSRHVIIYDPSIFEKGKTYILNYTLYYSYNKQFKVKDAAIDIKIPEQLPEDKNYAEYTVYIPHSLFMRYQKYTDALKGKDQKYKMLLADPKLVFGLLSALFTGGASKIFDEDSRSFITAFISALNSNSLDYYIGPKIAFPQILTEDAKDSELAIFSEPFNFRDFNYRLFENGFNDPGNYWSKLAKVIILQAEMLRNYKYTESLTLVISRIAALLITLTVFENRFIKTISNGKEEKINLFQWAERKFGGINPFLKGTLNKLDAFKIGALTEEGALLTILNLPILRDAIMSPIINNVLSKIAGKENVPLLIALSFKIIRFFFVYFISSGKFVGDVLFEILFQAVSFIIAHALMMIHNFFNQLLVFIELGSVRFSILTANFNMFHFISNQFKDVSYSELRKQMLLPPGEPLWNKRTELKGAADLSQYSFFEKSFYFVADAYLVVESVTGMILSIVRGLDGIKFKLKDVGRGKIAEQIFNLSKNLTGNIGKKDITRYYLAFVAGIFVDNIIKIGWIYAFYLSIIYSGVNELLPALVTTLQLTLPALTFFIGAKAPTKSIEKNFQKALELSDEDAKSLKSLADKIKSSSLKLNDMIQTFYYDSKFFDEFIGYLRDANLLLIRSYYRITDANTQVKMLELKTSYENELADLMLLLFAIVNSPSSRSLALETDYINSKINSISEILYNSSRLINNATINGYTLEKLGPLIVINPSDVFVNYYPVTNEIYAVISNVGDEDVNVKLELLETNATGSYSSNVVNLKARSTEMITLKPIKKAGNYESVDATLLVYVNDQLLYDLMINIPLTVGPYSASGNGIEVYSDGPVSITDNGIKITNSTLVQILLPKSDSRYVALLNGKMIRSAEIYSDSYTILAVAFNRPVEGTITYKSIKQDVEYLEGTGSVKGKTGVTIESSGKFNAQVSLLHDNPYPEATLPDVRKIIAIDLLSAEAGYVTVKISFEDLGITDPSELHLYKYNATSENYQEVKDYQVDMESKIIIFKLKPGDPVFALTKGAISREEGTTSKGGAGLIFGGKGVSLPSDLIMLIIILAVVPLIIVAALAIKKAKKKK